MFMFTIKRPALVGEAVLGRIGEGRVRHVRPQATRPNLPHFPNNLAARGFVDPNMEAGFLENRRAGAAPRTESGPESVRCSAFGTPIARCTFVNFVILLEFRFADDMADGVFHVHN
jgi:hypothetical protein